MGSTRLPGKVLMPIAGTPLVQRVVERVAAAKKVDQIIVATTEDSSDNELAGFLQGLRIVKVYRGARDDVLDRYYQCALLAEADIVVRITADDPLKDPEVIDLAISAMHGDATLDYVSNTLVPSFPEGLDVEVFRFAALSKAWHEASLESEREHVTPYIWKHPELFLVQNISYQRDLSSWRWTVDKPEDVLFMTEVFKWFSGQPLVSFREVISWLDAHPEIRSINAGTIRNEGYLRSLEVETKNE
jgi:spore coat polysaccharide biosynthesis protein SpsF